MNNVELYGSPVCAGLFGPCSNPPDPACRLDDPDGALPPVHRCRACAEACDAIFARAEREGKLERLAFEVDAALIATSPGRGKT